MYSRSPVAALALASCLVIVESRAQDIAAMGPSDESILFQDIPSVYGASKHEQKTSEAPSSVTIITATDIRNYGYRTMADILRSARNFYTTYDRNYEYVGVRGFGRPGDYNSRVLLLLDGHRVNDNIFSSASIGTEGLVDVDLIDRVEIIRGPGSSLYGTGAFFGVVNVITKKGRDLDGGQVAAAAGTLETYKGRASAGKQLTNGAEFLLSATGYHSAGQKELFFPEFDSPSTNNGIASNLDTDHYSSLFGALSFGDFTLQSSSVTRIKNIPTASFGSIFGVPGTNTTDTRQYVDLSYRRHLEHDAELTVRAYWDRYAYQGNYLTDPAAPVTNHDVADGQYWGTEAQYAFSLSEKHRLTLGGEYIDYFKQALRNYDLQTGASFVDSSTTSRSFGTFVQDEYRALDNLIFNLGLRYDYFYNQGSSVNPRLAAIWLPRPGTSLKFLYGTAFRAPNVYELYWGGADPSVNSLNSNLQPEKIKTTEAIWEQELGARWRSTVAAFHYRLTRLISLVPDPANPPQFVFVNSAPIRSIGIAFELGYRSPAGLEARASYSYQDIQVTDTGARLSNAPLDLFKLNLAIPLWHDRLTAGFEQQYVGARLTLAGNTVGGYAISNFTLTNRQRWHGFDFSASVYNLFDKRYFDPGTGNMVQDAIEQDGRVLLFKAAYSF